jgi:hypothetical protein
MNELDLLKIRIKYLRNNLISIKNYCDHDDSDMCSCSKGMSNLAREVLEKDSYSAKTQRFPEITTKSS